MRPSSQKQPSSSIRGAVAGEVRVRPEAREVVGDVPLVVVVQRPEHPRPRPAQHQVAAAALRYRVAQVVNNCGVNSRERHRCRSGLECRQPGQRRDHDAARLRLPPRVDDRAAAAADVLPVPDPRLGVDRLAHRAQQPQRAEVVCRGVLGAGLDEGPDQGRGRVVLGHAVALDDLPVAVGRRVHRVALVQHAGDAVVERAVDDVRVPGHPADVGRAPVRVAVLDVEDPAVGDGRVRQVAAGGVHHSLRLGGRARRVQREQHVLGLDLLRLAVG